MSPAPVIDATPGVLAAIVGDGPIAALLGQYQGAPAVHTRRPVPEASGSPLVVISEVTVVDQDGINDHRPTVTVDVTCYGDQPTHYRDVEEVAHRLRSLFHRRPQILDVPDYSVTDIRATGPYPGPTDDDSRVARRVTLAIRLYSK